MIITGENILLIGAILLFVAVLAGKLAYRFGAPALLLFLGVGLFFGYHFISFSSPVQTRFIGMIALCIILFSGGMDTKFSEIRPVLAPGITLATVGVILTALAVGGFAWAMAPLFDFKIPFPVAMLLASTMASTDSASVFSILRTKKQGLDENLRPLLELESGSNDPTAYILVTLLLTVVSVHGEPTSFGGAVWSFILQMLIGVGVGYGCGRGAVWSINKIEISNAALYSVLLLAFTFFTFAFTELVGGNGFLAVYVAGLVVGNKRIVHKRTLVTFFDGITWLLQIVMFLALGLFVDLRTVFNFPTIIYGLSISIFLMLIARPAAVFISLAPFRRFSLRARTYVSWVGLRGAVPIIFAIYPIVYHIDKAELLFNIVFIVTITSLILQGTTVSGMANLLGLTFEEHESRFGDALQDGMRSSFSEIDVNEQMLSKGCTLSEITLPDNTLVVMVCRDGDYFVPSGQTSLQIGDSLLIISDRNEELQDCYNEFGIEEIIQP